MLGRRLVRHSPQGRGAAPLLKQKAKRSLATIMRLVAGVCPAVRSGDSGQRLLPGGWAVSAEERQRRLQLRATTGHIVPTPSHPRAKRPSKVPQEMHSEIQRKASSERPRKVPTKVSR